MSVTIRQLHPVFAGEVSGIDLRAPLLPDQLSAIEAGMDRYAVLVFPGQDISDEQQLAFSRCFGELEQTGGGNITKHNERRLAPEFADVSNLGKDGKPLERDARQRMFNLANRLWHSDSSFRAIPAKYSILSGRRVSTTGGDTEFADMRAAYDALDARIKAMVADMICEHSLLHSRAKLGFDTFTEEEREKFRPVRHTFVRTHPVTGRKSLYLSSHIGKILGWEVPEARAFLLDLTEHATAERFRYAHKWRPFDLVVWDNRQVMHRVRWFDDTAEIRDMRRTTVAGDAPTLPQAIAA